MYFLVLLLISLSSPSYAQEVVKNDHHGKEKVFFKMLLDEGIEMQKQKGYQESDVLEQRGDFYEMVSIKVLNKHSGKSQDLKMNIGDTAKIGYLIIRPISCWRSKQNDLFQNSKVLLEVYREIDHNLKRVFYGWVLEQDYFSPVIEDARYDIVMNYCS